MSAEEKDLLEVCRKSIEQNLNWGDGSDWSNKDFEDLSDRIFEKTQVKLSVTTLKRVWGKVSYDASFTAVTLNALVQFIGYESWRTFKQDSLKRESSENSNEPKNTAEVAGGHAGKVYETKKEFAKKIAVAGFALLLTGALIFIIFKEDKLKAARAIPEATFIAQKVTDDLPNSVIFTYDVSAFGADSVKIQQDWDPSRREKVSAKNNKHTSIYYYPGFFNAKLLVDDKVVREEKVFIKTKGWKGIIMNSPIPVYLSSKDIQRKGAIGVSTATLKEKLNTPVFNQKAVSFYNVREFGGLKSNYFFLETEIQNRSTVDESICRRANIQLLYDGGMVLLSFGDKGCVSELNLWTGTESVNGKENDLSEFGCDFSRSQLVTCEASNDTVKVALNGRPIFKRLSKIDEKDIIGLCITFEGAGEIQKLKLGEPSKRPVYVVEF